MTPQRKVTDEELLAVACPECKQPPGTWCVFISPTFEAEFVTSLAQKALLARVGTPTKRCHNGRYGAVYLARSKRERARRRYPPIERPSRTSLAILLASREFDAREREQVRAWLRANATLLTDLSK
jgi:hypothetical protein